MTEADLATRAPESDAAESANATPAAPPAADPKLCDDCVTDRPTRL